jgi:ATP-binding cassette subfamily C (CFTR/MRP) protein 1
MFKITKQNVYKISVSWLTVIKTVLVLILITIQFIYLIKLFMFNTASSMVYFMTPLVLISTYILVLVFFYYEIINGWRSSTLLFVFWFLLSLSTFVSLRSKLKFLEKYYNASIENAASFDLIIFFSNSLAIFGSLILSTLSEKNFVEIDNRAKSPEYTAPLLSRLTFWWINSYKNSPIILPKCCIQP